MEPIHFTDELRKIIKRVQKTKKPETVVSENQKLTISPGKNLSGDIATVYVTTYSPKGETKIEIPVILNFNFLNLDNMKFHDTDKNVLSELKKNQNYKR